jgi:hypothetical protein
MSKVKYLIKNIPNIITGFMPQLARGLRRNITRQVKLRRPTFYNTNRRRRRRYGDNNNGVEINHADGGLKQNYSKQQTRLVPINAYGRLMAVKGLNDVVEYKMQLLSDSYAFNTDNIDLRTELNRSSEFIEWRRFSTQYKVKGINTTINYNYHQAQGDYFPRLLLMYNTDTIETYNLNYENNAMNLDLTKVGTKNYNLKLNKRNMSVNNVDWINSDTSYSGNLNLLVSQQDSAFFGDGTTEYTIIGTVKFTFNVIFRLRDVRVMVNKRICEKAKGVNEFERELDDTESIINDNRNKEEEKVDKNEEKEVTTSESGTQCNMYEGISLKPFRTDIIYQEARKAIEISNKANDKQVNEIRDLMLKMLKEYDLYVKDVAIQFTKLINFLPNENDENNEIKCGIKNFDKEFEFLDKESSRDISTIPQLFRQCQAKMMLHICSNGKKYLWTEKDEYTFRDIVNKLSKAKIIERNKEYEQLLKMNGLQKNPLKKKSKKNNKKKKKKNNKIKNDNEEME